MDQLVANNCVMFELESGSFVALGLLAACQIHVDRRVVSIVTKSGPL